MGVIRSDLAEGHRGMASEGYWKEEYVMIGRKK